MSDKIAPESVWLLPSVEFCEEMTYGEFVKRYPDHVVAKSYLRGREEGAAEAWEEAFKLACWRCKAGGVAILRHNFWEHLKPNGAVCFAHDLRQRREALKKEQAK